MTPARSARARLQSILQPGQTIYLILRHTNRRKTHAEISVFSEFGPWRDISADVASALRAVYGVHGGVVLRRDPDHDSSAYLAAWLSELCGFADDPIRYQWL